ncbi:MAG: SDR family NAD(P)-dependent oxidoreductase [Blautia sp.]|nr:SDR family NAD(P)-dependent oxidoreductase [Blautia sp.]
MEKTVVITGSSKGLGLEMAKGFAREGYRVVLNGTRREKLEEAREELLSLGAEVLCVSGNVSLEEDVNRLLQESVKAFGQVDIWINNAGVNQPMKALWDLERGEIEALLDVDLKGAILGSLAAYRQMRKQESGGFIYNVEGHGSNDAMVWGLNMYGTCKRAVTHFTRALAKEAREEGEKVKVGRLSPGIMITDLPPLPFPGGRRSSSRKRPRRSTTSLGIGRIPWLPSW